MSTNIHATRGSVVGAVVCAAFIALAGESLCRDRGAEARIKVHGRVVSATGRPIGARFAVCSGDPLRCLTVGRTDAEGQIVADVDADAVTSRIVVLAESRGWIGNSRPEVQWRGEVGVAPCAQIEYDRRPDELGRKVVWDLSGLASRAAEEISSMGAPGSRVTCREEDGWLIELDQAAVAATVVPGEREIHTEVIQFPRYRAACEVEISTDVTTISRAWMDGYDVNRFRPSGDPMYPHFALSFRGTRLRLVMDRAAARVVRRDPASLPFVRLDGRLLRIDLGPDGTSRMGDEREVLRATLAPQAEPESLPGNEGFRLRPAPEEPLFWAFMEQTLR